MKIRSMSMSIIVACAGALAFGGCASKAESTAESVASAASPTAPLVLASPTDSMRADSMQEMLEAPRLAARLDSTMGAPGSTLVIDDVTAVGVFDRQYTWNGRMFDSYSNTRWTTRLQRR